MQSLYSYVSAMVPVKTMKEYDLLQEVVVLFCETVQRYVKDSKYLQLKLQMKIKMVL